MLLLDDVLAQAAITNWLKQQFLSHRLEAGSPMIRVSTELDSVCLLFWVADSRLFFVSSNGGRGRESSLYPLVRASTPS